jgi:hypothetical protein
MVTAIPPPLDVDELRANDLCQVIVQHQRQSERSIQVEIGPSEIGTACERRLALALLGSKRPNVSRDEWAAIVGTACHKVAAEAFIAHNDSLSRSGYSPRWLVEQEITIRPGLFGHCDLYDLVTHTVIDHKFPGATAIRKYKTNGHPGQQYQWQAHLYGYGWANLGMPVATVGIMFYPRSGVLRDAFLWTEPYSPAIAAMALARVDDLLMGMNLAETKGAILDDFMLALRRNTEYCNWCPYLERDNSDPTNGCKGPFSDPEYLPEKGDMTIPGILA